MAKKSEKQGTSARQPRQDRSRHKVELIFEATIRLLEKGGLDGLTTNAIALSAGVSIGTLYQFFPNREAILGSLADREIAAMSDRVTEAMENVTIASTQARIEAVVHAVLESYGARRAAHRLVMEYSLERGGNRLSPLLTKIIGHLSRERGAGAFRHAMGQADAFVLAHAFAGVLRAMIRQGRDAPPQKEVANALARLVSGLI